MTSRRCCCEVDLDCACSSCDGGVASCCYVIEIEDAEYTVIWTDDCIWRNPIGEATEILMTISGTTLSLEVGFSTYSVDFSEDTDCLNWDSLEVPETGEGEISAYVTATQNECYGCTCYCEECEDLATGMNAACCYSIQYDGTLYYLYKTDDCEWYYDDCDGLELTLSISGTTVTFTDGTSTWLYDYGTAPNCCTSFVLPKSGGGDSVTIIATQKTNCFSEEFECATVTFSGIENICGCSACELLNDTFYLTQDAYGAYVGSLCNSNTEYDKCGLYDEIEMGISESQEWKRITIEIDGSAVWQGYVPPTGPYVVPFVSASLEYCEFSGSEATVELQKCGPCTSYTCDEYEDDEDCWCRDDVWPDYYEVVVPDGFLGTWGFTGTQTFQVPVTTCPAAFGAYQRLQVATSGCTLPWYVEVIFNPWLHVRLWWGPLSGPWTYLRFYLSGFDPYNYCEGDGPLSWDCWLYGETHNLYYGSSVRSYCSPPNPPWDSAIPVTLRAL